MIDFSPLRNKEVTFTQFAAGFTRDDLAQFTNEMVDKMLALIADCKDADVVFLPVDPDAHNAFAADSDAVDLAWTLGHVIVHTTASAEESAFLAAEMARGIPIQPRRSRYEVPWQTVTTIAQCRARLEESRHMRLSSLALWPDAPHLDIAYTPWPAVGKVNALGRFLLGLRHDDDHLGQIADIVQQAQASRS